jgi:hypothetical protein
MSAATAVIGQRAELLAKLHLTRRLNIDVHRFDEGGRLALDFICTIRSKEVPGFLPFGVFVWGTTEDLATEEEAAAFGRTKWKQRDRWAYCMPVIALAYSMESDDGFFCWIVEPCKDTGKLLNVSHLRFKPFGPKQLDRVIKRIVGWYRTMQSNIVTEAGETDASECRDDE